jgi:hypothetical protein
MRAEFGQSQVEVRQEANWKCAANGCNLPGGASHEFGQHAKYYCTHHYGKPYTENDKITFQTRKIEDIYKALHAIKNFQEIATYDAWIRKHGREDLAPRVVETRFGVKVDEWKNESALRWRVFQTLKKEVQEKASTSQEYKKPMPKIAQFLDEF